MPLFTVLNRLRRVSATTRRCKRSPYVCFAVIDRLLLFRRFFHDTNAQRMTTRPSQWVIHVFASIQFGSDRIADEFERLQRHRRGDADRDTLD